MFRAEYYEILRFYIHQLFEVGFSKAVRMCAALPFVVLYDTEFILDTNAIDCYHKFDHQPRRGKPRRESRVDREERLVFVRRLPANRPFTGGFLMNGFFAGSWYGKQ